MARVTVKYTHFKWSLHNFIGTMTKGNAEHENKTKAFETAAVFKAGTTAVLSHEKYFNDDNFFTVEELATLIFYRNDDYIQTTLIDVLSQSPIKDHPERIFAIITSLCDPDHEQAAIRKAIVSKILSHDSIILLLNNHANDNDAFARELLNNDLYLASDETDGIALMSQHLATDYDYYLGQPNMMAELCDSKHGWATLQECTQADPSRTMTFLNCNEIYIPKNYTDLIEFYLEKGFAAPDPAIVNLLFDRNAFLLAFLDHWNKPPEAALAIPDAGEDEAEALPLPEINCIDQVNLSPADAAGFIIKLLGKPTGWPLVEKIVTQFCEKYKDEHHFITPLLQLNHVDLQKVITPYISADEAKDQSIGRLHQLLMNIDYLRHRSDEEITELLKNYTARLPLDCNPPPEECRKNVINQLVQVRTPAELFENIFNPEISAFAATFIYNRDLPGELLDFDYFMDLIRTYQDCEVTVKRIVARKIQQFKDNKKPFGQWIASNISKAPDLLTYPVIGNSLITQCRQQLNKAPVLLKFVELMTEENHGQWLDIINNIVKKDRQELSRVVNHLMKEKETDQLFNYCPDFIPLANLALLMDHMLEEIKHTQVKREEPDPEEQDDSDQEEDTAFLSFVELSEDNVEPAIPEEEGEEEEEEEFADEVFFVEDINPVELILSYITRDDYPLENNLKHLSAKCMFQIYQEPQIVDHIGGRQVLLNIPGNKMFTEAKFDDVSGDYYTAALQDVSMAFALLSHQKTHQLLGKKQQIDLLIVHANHGFFLKGVNNCFKPDVHTAKQFVIRTAKTDQFARTSLLSKEGQELLIQLEISPETILNNIQTIASRDAAILNLMHRDYDEFLSEEQKLEKLQTLWRDSDPGEARTALLAAELLVLRPSFSTIKDMADQCKPFAKLIIDLDVSLYNEEILTFEQIKKLAKVGGGLFSDLPIKISSGVPPRGRPRNPLFVPAVERAATADDFFDDDGDELLGRHDPDGFF